MDEIEGPSFQQQSDPLLLLQALTGCWDSWPSESTRGRGGKTESSLKF